MSARQFKDFPHIKQTCRQHRHTFTPGSLPMMCQPTLPDTDRIWTHDSTIYSIMPSSEPTSTPPHLHPHPGWIANTMVKSHSPAKLYPKALSMFPALTKVAILKDTALPLRRTLSMSPWSLAEVPEASTMVSQSVPLAPATYNDPRGEYSTRLGQVICMASPLFTRITPPLPLTRKLKRNHWPIFGRSRVKLYKIHWKVNQKVEAWTQTHTL